MYRNPRIHIGEHHQFVGIHKKKDGDDDAGGYGFAPPKPKATEEEHKDKPKML